ncbi:MAG: hypothetical protein LQ343_006147 [Gyalolechia ehrenbergii]|nr:MAG: hypothetical protein LQ343_006147 [Gyalolechia ehrenbergii]
MDDSPSALLRLLIPKLPFIAKTALWHSLWLSPTSSKWDLRTEITVRIIRSLLDNPKPTPLLEQQRWSVKDPGIKGKMWISKVTLAKPEEEDIRNILTEAIDSMDGGRGTYTVPAIVPVEAEWTGHRANVRHDRPRLDLSEVQHYEKLMAEVTSPVTILYLHGGVYYMMDPCSHRIPTSRLAHLSNGRCLSIRYRLAPQNPFPHALLDAFQAYLSLMYPPPDSFHEPVSASNIVFAGDSAGGNLSLALVQLILQINRSCTRKNMLFHRRTIDLPIPVPAGLAGCCPWADISRCMPSVITNAQWDYLPAPMTNDAVSRFPHDAIWPTDPPRGDVFCDLSMLCHPLVSPLAAKDWTGSCPMWLGYGEEMLADEGKAVASLAAKQGVTVIWEQFEAMPHCFPMIFDQLPASRKYNKDWADFCGTIASDTVGEGGAKLETKGIWFAVKTCKETNVNVMSLAVCSQEEVEERMRRTKEASMKGDEGEAKILPKL